jgi:hypothetical protein
MAPFEAKSLAVDETPRRHDCCCPSERVDNPRQRQRQSRLHLRESLPTHPVLRIPAPQPWDLSIPLTHWVSLTCFKRCLLYSHVPSLARREHAYCLMTNHHHLVVETPNANLGKAPLGSVPLQLPTAKPGAGAFLLPARRSLLLNRKQLCNVKAGWVLLCSCTWRARA